MRITYILLLISILFSSCYPSPTFPEKPEIELENFYFVENSQTDSLVISLSFTDGDGDLGLSNLDTDFPYHQFNVFSSETGEELHEIAAFDDSVTLSDLISNAIRFEDKRTGKVDSLPPYISPYKCTRWKTNFTLDNGQTIEDTLYYQRNPYYYNFYVQFYYKETVNSEFQELNFDEIGANCNSNYHGRFPLLLERNKEDKPLEGTITYSVTGSGLSMILDRKILKLRLFIYDRALNRSNPVETKEFILSEITI